MKLKIKGGMTQYTEERALSPLSRELCDWFADNWFEIDADRRVDAGGLWLFDASNVRRFCCQTWLNC